MGPTTMQVSSGGHSGGWCTCHHAETLVGFFLRSKLIPYHYVYCHQQTGYLVVFPSPGAYPRFLPPPLHIAGFVELGPLAWLHEGPPACHPNTLLINSILTELSPGSSQEGVETQSTTVFVLASYFPLLFSDLLEGYSFCHSNSASSNSLSEQCIGYSAWEWSG